MKPLHFLAISTFLFACSAESTSIGDMSPDQGFDLEVGPEEMDIQDIEDADDDTDMASLPRIAPERAPVLLPDNNWIAFQDELGTILGEQDARFRVLEVRPDTYVRSIIPFKLGYAMIRQEGSLKLEYYEGATLVPTKSMLNPPCQTVLNYQDQILLACQGEFVIVEEAALELRIARRISRQGFASANENLGTFRSRYALSGDVLFEQIEPQSGQLQIFAWNLAAESEDDVLIGSFDVFEGYSNRIAANGNYLFVPFSTETAGVLWINVYSHSPLQLVNSWNITELAGETADTVTNTARNIYANAEWVVVNYQTLRGRLNLVLDARSADQTCIGTIPWTEEGREPDYFAFLQDDQIVYSTDEEFDYPVAPFASTKAANIQLNDCP